MANLTNPTEYRRQTFAQDGFRVVDNTFAQPAGEEYVAVYCIANTTNTVLTTANGDDLNGRDLQQGMIIYGNITAVSVGTGELIAYIK
jgi:hypothetical protein